MPFERCCRKHVGKEVKVFNVGNEFIQHAFEAHLFAAITNYLKLSSPTDTIDDPS